LEYLKDKFPRAELRDAVQTPEEKLKKQRLSIEKANSAKGPNRRKRKVED